MCRNKMRIKVITAFVLLFLFKVFAFCTPDVVMKPAHPIRSKQDVAIVMGLSERKATENIKIPLSEFATKFNGIEHWAVVGKKTREVGILDFFDGSNDQIPSEPAFSAVLCSDKNERMKLFVVICKDEEVAKMRLLFFICFMLDQWRYIPLYYNQIHGIGDYGVVSTRGEELLILKGNAYISITLERDIPMPTMKIKEIGKRILAQLTGEENFIDENNPEFVQIRAANPLKAGDI